MQEQQGTISALPTTNIQGPLHTLGTQPGLDAAYTAYSFNPTQYNQSGYLGGVAATGKLDRTLGAAMLAGTLGAKLPSFAPGTAGGNLVGELAGMEATSRLLNEASKAISGKDIGENVRSGLESTLGYNPETWNPYVQGIYNLTTDLANPGYWGTSRWLRNGINAAENVGRYMVDDIANSWRTMRYQLAHPESQTYGIIPDNIQFRSELDWSPESWFGTRATNSWDAEDVMALNSHILST